MSLNPNDLMRDAQQHLKVGHAREAILSARAAGRLTRDQGGGINLGGILIDAGSQLRSSRLVREGIALTSGVLAGAPPRALPALHYNLGNGYGALAQHQRGRGPGTRPALSLCISWLDESLKQRPFLNARTNLANALAQEQRLIEALDEYSVVLTEQPSHHQALAQRGHALMSLYRWIPRHRGLLSAALDDHLRAIDLAADEPLFQRSYQRVIDFLRQRTAPAEISSVDPSPYAKWIWNNRLNLNPCPLCRLDTPEAFDIFPLGGWLRSPRRRPTEGELLELINALCQSFATARWTLYQALSRPPEEAEHLVMVPASPPAIHSLTCGLLMAAASGFYALLNQVAFSMNIYFQLNRPPQAIWLSTIWCRSSRANAFPTTRSAIQRRLLSPPNPGLTALYGMTRSLERAYGRYYPLRELRNSIEHQVVVALSEPARVGGLVGVHIDALKRSALDLGRLAKAALWYLATACSWDERHRARRAALRGHLITPGLAPHTRRH